MKALEMLSKKHLEKNIQEVISSAADVVVKAWNSTMEFFSATCGMAQKEAFSNLWHMDERSTWKCSRLG